MDEKEFLQAEFEKIKKIKRDIQSDLDRKLSTTSAKPRTLLYLQEWLTNLGDSFVEMGKQINSVGKDVEERLAATNYEQEFIDRVREEYERVVRKLTEDFVEENK